MSPSSIDKEMDDVQRSFDAIQLNDTVAAMKKNKKARQRSNKNNLIIVGMVQQESLRSLANFNLCSKTLYVISLPVLWKEVAWKTNTWKYAQDRRNGYPPGWQYITFSGKSPWFWKGLVDTLNVDEVYLGSDQLVRARWPNLKACVRTEALMNVEVPQCVWLTIPDENNQQPPPTGSPVKKVIKMAYKAWNIAATMIPKFMSSYEAVDRAFIDWSISGKPLVKRYEAKDSRYSAFPSDGPTRLRI